MEKKTKTTIKKPKKLDTVVNEVVSKNEIKATEPANVATETPIVSEQNDSNHQHQMQQQTNIPKAKVVRHIENNKNLLIIVCALIVVMLAGLGIGIASSIKGYDVLDSLSLVVNEEINNSNASIATMIISIGFGLSIIAGCALIAYYTVKKRAERWPYISLITLLSLWTLTGIYTCINIWDPLNLIEVTTQFSPVPSRPTGILADKIIAWSRVDATYKLLKGLYVAQAVIGGCALALTVTGFVMQDKTK